MSSTLPSAALPGTCFQPIIKMLANLVPLPPPHFENSRLGRNV